VRPAPRTIVPPQSGPALVSWLLSLVIAVLTGIAGLLGAGFVSALAVEWYSISSFEGGSGFFVVGNALLGGIAGGLIGLIAARLTAARPQPTFLKGIRNAVGAVAILLAAIAGAARVFADVPPEIDGETLVLHVELRSPASDTTDLRALPGQPYVRLAATAPFSTAERVSEQGPLWVEDLRREDGRWIVPGAVAIFTARGKKVVDVGVGDKMLMGLLTPLPGSPSARDMDWSPWYPHAPEGQPPLPDQFTLRYRVVRASDPLRTETAGPFEIDLMVSSFYNVSDTDRFAARTTFAVRHQGQAVDGLEQLDGVAVVGGAVPALVVKLGERTSYNACRLVSATDGKVTVQPLSVCAYAGDGDLLVADRARYLAARDRVHVPGWLDRESMATPGLYVFADAILDTRNLTLRTVRLVGPSDESPNPNVPPLGVSPDERSVAWYTSGSDDAPAIGVTDTVGGRHALLPIDRPRMRYANLDQIDPAWLMHHFAWVRGSDGIDRLEVRADFVPLPYRGEFSNENDYANYQWEPAGQPLRAALEEWLVAALKAEPRPGNQPDAFSHTFVVDGVEINVMASDGSDYVSIAFPTGVEGDPAIIASIGRRFDEELKSGKYDELFRKDK
jgi:hypothetical protein